MTYKARSSLIIPWIIYIDVFQFDQIAIVSPRPKLHVAVLDVEWIVFDVYCTVAFVNHWRLPYYTPVKVNCYFCFGCYLIITICVIIPKLDKLEILKYYSGNKIQMKIKSITIRYLEAKRNHWVCLFLLYFRKH